MTLLWSFFMGLIATVAGLFACVYYWVTSNFDYWQKLRVPYIKPSFPFGNFSDTFLGKTSFPVIFHDFYREFKKTGFGGVYNVRSPIFVVCKRDLIKQILTKDFNSFHDRGVPFDEENDPFSANLFNIGGKKWKDLRAKLSPTFTSGKIKGMFPLIHACTREMRECIQAQIKKSDSVEMQDLLVRFTTDVIGTCAFGIDCNSLKDPDSEFHRMGRDVFKRANVNTIRTVLVAMFPKLFKRFTTFKSILSESTTFFTNVMKNTVRHRRENNVERNDFVQLMLKIMDEQKEDHFNLQTMATQGFLFFTAGLDNVSNNIGFCLHAMALDPALQELVCDEIWSVLEDCGGEMSYEALDKMKLLSRVIDEGLRLYTPAGILLRTVTEDKYRIPDTDIELPKKSMVMVPIQSMHLDEEIFPNPHKFDPSRFTEENKSKRHPYDYLPFGEGPRFCIASRFALLEMRLCLAELIRHFHFGVAPETDLVMELDPTNFSPKPKHKFWLRVFERDLSGVDSSVDSCDDSYY